MKIGRVDVCDECGAAYTRHTRECSHWAEPAPMQLRAMNEDIVEPPAAVRDRQYAYADIDLGRFGEFSLGGMTFPALRTITFPPASEDTIKRVNQFFNRAILGQREDESDAQIKKRLIAPELGRQQLKLKCERCGEEFDGWINDESRPPTKFTFDCPECGADVERIIGEVHFAGELTV